MKPFCNALSACAVAFIGLAHARPVVLEEIATLRPPPDPTWQYFGSFGVAIDGDWALVSGERFDNDSNPDNGGVHEGTVFLYQRSGANWNYVGQLGPVEPFLPNITPGLGMKDGIAIRKISDARVYERSGTTWTWTSYIDIDLNGTDIEVSGARALIPELTCSYSSIVAHDNGGLWTSEARLRLSPSDCGGPRPFAFGDIEGDRVAILRPEDSGGPALARIWYFVPNTGWLQFAPLENGSVGNVLGPEIALAGPYVAITGSRERGTSIAYQLNNAMFAWAHTGLQAVDSYLEPNILSATNIERAGSMFAQRNYSFDRGAYVINVFRVNDDAGHSSTHVATLQTRQGTSVGFSIDASNNRIIVSGRTNLAGDNVVRIFALPANFETPAAQVHDFDAPSAGAVWQPSPGSRFSVATSGSTGVYRQVDTAGDAISFLPSSTARNQAIQAEVTIRSVVGADRWAGLLTRRTDDSNYYYVTLRTSGTVQLRRKVGGVFTTLASAPATVTTGRRYRLRLESIGTTHRVYLDDRVVLTARDATLTDGDAGVAMYRASADFDNVIVTPSPLTTIYTQNFANADISRWSRTSGTWQSTGGVLRQRFSADYARAFLGTPTDDQVVQARIRPVTFVAPGTWVGLMARYQDDRNYLYVSLVGRGRVSLWRRTNAVITQLATRQMTVSPGTWYDVRVEIVDGLTRVYVNNQLMLSTNADPGPMVASGVEQKGHVGLVTYRATADFDDFRAYQP